MRELKSQALIAIHQPELEPYITRNLNRAGFEVIKKGSIDEMLDAMGIPTNSFLDTSPSKPYAWYIMDVNLGSPGGDSYEPASTIYQHIKSDVESGRSNFMAISGNNTAIVGAKDAGIPCMDKSEIIELYEMIGNSKL